MVVDLFESEMLSGACLREAVKLGFKAAVIPKRMRVRFNPPKNFEVIEARSLKNALQLSLLS